MNGEASFKSMYSFELDPENVSSISIFDEIEDL